MVVIIKGMTEGLNRIVFEVKRLFETKIGLRVYQLMMSRIIWDL